MKNQERSDSAGEPPTGFSRVESGSLRAYEKTILWQLRERLMDEVRERVGKTQMTIDNIVRAIGDGAAEHAVLELQRLARDEKTQRELQRIMHVQIYSAVLNYHKNGAS